MKKLPNLNLEQVLPEPGYHHTLNTCRNPDCVNFTEIPSHNTPHHASKAAAAARRNTNNFGRGIGDFAMTVAKKSERGTKGVHGSVISWNDGRTLVCKACQGKTTILSEVALDEEIDRLNSMNGALDGPRCPRCETRYLDFPEEFKLNGKNGKGFRVIHDHDGDLGRPPCKHRFTITPEHTRQRKSSDNHRILQELINGSGFHDCIRALSAGKNQSLSVGRLYERIFWLERTLLAYEKTQLRKWKRRIEKSGVEPHHRLAHDAVHLSINWETADDRRVSQLLCSATADADTGYIYRIDANFDPEIDPVDFMQQEYFEKRTLRLGRNYVQKNGKRFKYPMMKHQRPTARFQEHMFFASVLHRFGHFKDNEMKKITQPKEAQDCEERINKRYAQTKRIYRDYYNMKKSERDYRSPFTGAMISETFTQAAHFSVLKNMLPKGSVTLVTDAGSTFVRHVALMFADEIKNDKFTWLAVSSEKDAATKIDRQKAVAEYRKELSNWKNLRNKSGPIQDYRAEFVADKMLPGVPPNDSYRGAGSEGSIWVHTPVQTNYEIEKSVGIVVPPQELRNTVRKYNRGLYPIFQPQCTTRIDDAKAFKARGEIAELIDTASLHAVDTFFNSLRERVPATSRSSTGGASKPGSYIRGNVFNPRVLIALLNIFRVYYNYFELRPYQHEDAKKSAKSSAPKTRKVSVPGTKAHVEITTRAKGKIDKRTPAQRHGVHRAPKGEPSAPDIMKVLYQPWIFAGTPLWKKMKSSDN